MKIIIVAAILFFIILVIVLTFGMLKVQTGKIGGACIQVITPAISLTGECKEFPTPCDVPYGWKKVESCSAENLK